MNFYGTYRDHATGKWAVGEIPVIKETDKKFFVERVQAGAFNGQFNKVTDGFYTQAKTPSVAIDLRRSSLLSRIQYAEKQLLEAYNDLNEFNKDMEDLQS